MDRVDEWIGGVDWMGGCGMSGLMDEMDGWMSGWMDEMDVGG